MRNPVIFFSNTKALFVFLRSHFLLKLKKTEIIQNPKTQKPQIRNLSQKAAITTQKRHQDNKQSHSTEGEQKKINSKLPNKQNPLDLDQETQCITKYRSKKIPQKSYPSYRERIFF